MDEDYMMTWYNIKAIVYCGIWPSNVKKYPFLNKLHKIYGKCIFVIYIVFFISMIVQLFFIWTDILELMFTLSLALLYFVILPRISLLFSDKEKIFDLLETTRLFQDKVMNDFNEKNKEIFLRYVNITKFVSRGWWVIVVSTVMFLATPGFLAVFDINDKIKEDGTIIKALPFGCWLPFDQQKHHLTAFITQILICIPGTAYVAIWDTFAFSLMMHGICAIKVLQNSLISLGQNGAKSAYESAADCVQLHQEIIKVFWILVVMSGVCGAIYMTMIFWDRFTSNPIRITIQPVHKQTSVIPFPGVTICTAIRQVPKRVDRLLESLTLPEDVTLEQVKQAIPSLMGYTQPVEVDHDAIALLHRVFRKNGNFTVNRIFSLIEPDCSEMLLKCRWEQQVVPCSEIFKTTMTHDGHCCSFNTRVGSQKITKYRTLFYGAQMGLSVILNPETSNISEAVSTLSSTGIKILIHSPEDYPGISSIEKILGNGTETYMRILGTKLTSSESVKSLTAEQRSCLFEDERELEYFPSYRDTNCGVECRMNSLYYFCKCIPFTYPKSNKRICGLSDIACLTDNYNSIYRNPSKKSFIQKLLANNSDPTKVSPCVCPSQCNDVFYAVQTSSIPISYNVPTVSNFYNMLANDDILDKMVIHIYFGSFYQTEMLRDTITSTYYLLSSFGGVFSLFLGCSFLSILEILYFFCYRIFTKYND